MELVKKDTIEIETVDPPSEYSDFFDNGTGVLCVPTSNFRNFNGTVLKPDTYRLAKWIKQNHPEITIEVGKADAIVDLRSDEYWIPLAILANDITIPIYLNIIANFVYDMARGALNFDKKSVHLSAIYKSETGEFKQFSYDGSVDGLKESIKKFKLNRFFDK